MWFQADNNNNFFILTLKTIYAIERTIQIGNSFLSVYDTLFTNKSHTDAQKHLTEILRLMRMLKFAVHKAVLRTEFPRITIAFDALWPINQIMRKSMMKFNQLFVFRVSKNLF